VANLLPYSRPTFRLPHRLTVGALSQQLPLRLVHVLPVLWSDRGLLQQAVGAAGYRGDQVTSVGQSRSAPGRCSDHEVLPATPDRPFYSHSIINEPSKLLIRRELDVAPQTFTVILTVNLSGTSIGAGFRAVRPKLTFRDLSTSIDSRGDSNRHRHAPAPVTEAPKKGRHQTV